MSDIAASSFVRQDLVAERAAPVKTTGLVGFLRTRLFNTPTNILLTVASALLLWFVLVPTIRFLVVDAVWRGTDREACLAANAGHVVGACWPYVHAKLTQFIYGFYPEAERWRVNLTFILAALLLLPLLIPRLPAKASMPGFSLSHFRSSPSSCCMAAGSAASVSAGPPASCPAWPTRSARRDAHWPAPVRRPRSLARCWCCSASWSARSASRSRC